MQELAVISLLGVMQSGLGEARVREFQICDSKLKAET